MKTFADLRAEDRRLSMLLVLAASEGYEANVYLLQSMLEQFGHSSSLDRIKSDVAWLTEQGLTTTQDLGTVMVGKVTARGIDCAKGRVEVPGVKRPLPE